MYDLDLARELKKKLWNSDSDTNCNWYVWNDLQRFGNGLEDLEIGWQTETIQITALLRSASILRRVSETWGDLLSLTPVNDHYADVKNSQGIIMMIIMIIVWMKAQIENTQMNSKHRLCANRAHETVKHTYKTYICNIHTKMKRECIYVEKGLPMLGLQTPVVLGCFKEPSPK